MRKNSTSYKLKVLSIIEKFPYELSFALDAKTYDDYINTFVDVGISLEQESVLSESQFNTLKEYFKDE